MKPRTWRLFIAWSLIVLGAGSVYSSISSAHFFLNHDSGLDVLLKYESLLTAMPGGSAQQVLDPEGPVVQLLDALLRVLKSEPQLWVQLFLFTVVYGLITAGGIGLVRKDPWARSVSIGSCWAATALVPHQIYVVHRIFDGLLQAVESVMGLPLPPEAVTMLYRGTDISIILGTLGVFPVLVWIMSRPNFVKECASS
ncbi:MAG: hypothetical protein JW937_06430 [Candidatus Omnitrophica bacterium]|nr:hypothetical protein [Candidatus Omnitrophota bacterium]